MNLTLILSLVSALVAGAGTWVFEDARHTAAMSELRLHYADESIKAQAIAAKQQQDITTKYQGAINDSKTREAALRRDADSARSESDSLREQSTDAARRLSSAPAPAVLEYATAINELFADCSRRYQELGQKADGHASDVRTLIDAWPASPNAQKKVVEVSND